MKNFLISSSLLIGGMTFAQVGINTANPQGMFNIDAAKNNATTGTPTSTQTTDDFTILADGKVGIGTTVPSSLLDINGGVTFREIEVPAGSTTIQIPSGTSSIRITGSPGADVTLIAPSPAPVETGYRLMIINELTGIGDVQFSGYSIGTNRAMEYVYSKAPGGATGAWYTTESGGNFAAGSVPWKTIGNGAIDSNINFLGTTDANDLVIKTSNAERMRFKADGSVYFPGSVKTASVPGPYNGIGINSNTGQIGVYTPGSQPIYIAQSNVATASLDGNTFGSRGIDFGNTSPINTIGITYGEDAANTSEDYNNGNSGTVTNTGVAFYYYQVPAAGTYEFKVTGTIRCVTAYSDPNSYLTNMTVWKASSGSTNYVIQDDYRVLNIVPNGGRFGYPVSQSFILDLVAGDKISFRQYRAGSSGTWTGCQYTLPTNGAQKFSQRLTVIKL